MGSPIITVLYDHGIEGVAPEKIYRIHKNLAAYFSPVLKDCFPSKFLKHVNRKGCDGHTVVTVTGVVKNAYVMLFEWMLNSGNEDQKSTFGIMGFAKYARVYEAAEVLQVDYVQGEMLHRMNKIAAGQVPAQDVRMVYATYPKGHIVRQIVIRSIGDAILNRTLRRWSLYLDIRTDIVAYDHDITEYMRTKKREEQVALQGNKQKNRRGRKNRHIHGYQGYEGQGEPVIVEKQVAAPLARKGDGGRPAYYKLSATDFGASRW